MPPPKGPYHGNALPGQLLRYKRKRLYWCACGAHFDTWTLRQDHIKASNPMLTKRTKLDRHWPKESAVMVAKQPSTRNPKPGTCVRLELYWLPPYVAAELVKKDQLEWDDHFNMLMEAAK